MNELFGAPTSSIAVALVVLLGIALVSVAWIAVRNRPMFRMGIRNVPRRPAQSALVVGGLTLATLIVTAAFVTGDTINNSLRQGTYDLLGRTDLSVSFDGPRELKSDHGLSVRGEQTYVASSGVDRLEEAFAGSAIVEGVLPFAFEDAAATNLRTGTSVARVGLAGYDADRLSRLGGLDANATDGDWDGQLALAPDEVVVSERAAADLDLEAGDRVVLHSEARSAEYRVVAIVADELASGVLGFSFANVPGGIAMPLESFGALTGHDGEVNWISVVLAGGVEGSLVSADEAAAQVRSYLAGPGAADFATDTPPVVDTVKLDAIENGDQAGQKFTSLFLVLGLFAMAAGVMLVFTLFVMLAAERKPEMGMARAVGARRGHLVQAFICEGMAYSLFAGLAGVGLGVLASVGMTVGLLKTVGGDEFSLVSPAVTTNALVIGYCLGVVLTFLTVIFASLRVSHINIVAAIRGTEDSGHREGRGRTRWSMVALGTLAMVVPPLGLWIMLRKGFGLPQAWVWAPIGSVVGLAAMYLGHQSGSLFPFAFGISLLPLSLAAVAIRLGAPARATWTTVGALLLAYWALPSSLHDRIFGDFDAGIEMFVLSGVMMVVGSTIIIVFNAGLLSSIFAVRAKGRYRLATVLAVTASVLVATGALVGSGGSGLGQLIYLGAVLVGLAAAGSAAAVRFPRFAPALKMAVAYPLANRFRTGMTLAMFSLIVFSLTVFSILIANSAGLEGGDGATGGLDVTATAASAGAIDELAVRFQSADGVRSLGRTTVQGTDEEVRLAAEGGDWAHLPVIAGNDAFFGELAPTLDARAHGFATDAEVLEAVRTNPAYALLDRATLRGEGFVFDFDAGATVEDDTFEPFEVEVRNPSTGAMDTVTVIGALRARLPEDTFAGIYVNAEAYGRLFGTPDYRQAYVGLADGADATLVAKAIESSLALSGLEARSVRDILDDELAEDQVFTRMFQAFMALGLIVGIAGLGVIAMRSVVERRQQIGMLRAIGYQRPMVAVTFLLESAFIAVMGIVAGVAGGTVIGRNLMTSDTVSEGGAEAAFVVPWDELGAVAVLALAFSLLLTWWPSRGAARVPVAEALRYE